MSKAAEVRDAGDWVEIFGRRWSHHRARLGSPGGRFNAPCSSQRVLATIVLEGTLLEGSRALVFRATTRFLPVAISVRHSCLHFLRKTNAGGAFTGIGFSSSLLSCQRSIYHCFESVISSLKKEHILNDQAVQITEIKFQDTKSFEQRNMFRSKSICSVIRIII